MHYPSTVVDLATHGPLGLPPPSAKESAMPDEASTTYVYTFMDAVANKRRDM